MKVRNGLWEQHEFLCKVEGEEMLAESCEVDVPKGSGSESQRLEGSKGSSSDDKSGVGTTLGEALGLGPEVFGGETAAESP